MEDYCISISGDIVICVRPSERTVELSNIGERKESVKLSSYEFSKLAEYSHHVECKKTGLSVHVTRDTYLSTVRTIFDAFVRIKVYSSNYREAHEVYLKSVDFHAMLQHAEAIDAAFGGNRKADAEYEAMFTACETIPLYEEDNSSMEVTWSDDIDFAKVILNYDGKRSILYTGEFYEHMSRPKYNGYDDYELDDDKNIKIREVAACGVCGAETRSILIEDWAMEYMHERLWHAWLKRKAELRKLGLIKSCTLPLSFVKT